MKKIACGLMLCLATLPAMAQGASSNPTRCMTLKEVDRTMDPVQLTRSMLVCIHEGRDDDAVDLFNIGGVFAKFDSLRVSDVSAHAAYGALKVEAGNALSPDQLDRFQTALRTRSAISGYQETLCNTAGKLDPPSYTPTYMTNHGMGAFTGKPQMTENFQASVAWEEVRSEYLGCGL